MVSRVVAALTTIFVLVVIALFVRHHRAKAKNDERLAALVSSAREDDALRIEAIRRAMSAEPSQTPCPITTRARIVRLERIDERGARLHDINAAVAEEREPKELDRELDVVEGRAFLFDYRARRIVCIGKDADDPHGTLVAYVPVEQIIIGSDGVPWTNFEMGPKESDDFEATADLSAPDAAVSHFLAVADFGFAVPPDAQASYGGFDDTWKLDLAPSDVNDGTFGFHFKARITSGAATIAVDQITARVHYCE